MLKFILILVVCSTREFVFANSENVEQKSIEKTEHEISTVVEVTESEIPVTAKPDLLPFYDCCIRALSGYGGQPIKSGEFPALTLFQYQDSLGRTSFACAGSLINRNYVITAAHCVTGKILTKQGNLVKVRLGEHDWSKTICQDGVCNNDVLEIGIDKIIVHEEYDELKKFNDIALVRLAQPLTRLYSHISPICLRFAEDPPRTLIPDENHEYTVVGWGRTLFARQSKVGNKIYLPHFDHSECRQKYAPLRVNITNLQICAGGEFKKDACDGDSGGPLITNIDNCDYLDGIVSFGKGCGLENWPGIYTNVNAYKNWIINHLEPLTDEANENL